MVDEPPKNIAVFSDDPSLAEIKSIAKDKYDGVLRRYCLLMKELKRRFAVIKSALDGEFQMDIRTTEELCLFHFRMICELIALACLVAHEDIPETKEGRIRTFYQADAIIKSLSRLHPDFYPRPGLARNQGDLLIVEEMQDEYLSKEELLALYRKVGDVLHIGSIDRLSVNWSREIDLNEMGILHTKIMRLLNHHRINLVDEKLEIWVAMSDSAHNGDPAATLMVRMPHQQPPPPQAHPAV